MEAIGEFAESQTCRRLVLLNYFGEHRQTPCQNCDICLDPPKKYDGLMMRKSDVDDLSCGAVFRRAICDCGIAGNA